ncbi:MAG: hypothetical protein A3H28_09725 [Acidobacteria bacterium RIFCSPLOWO2_02_FULL_61_28]|nr:MAG: hypothetical protein A3H28_09725 [Acidobacteria bacterium RIFCSPLOWO2_02_FULL_61_28]
MNRLEKLEKQNRRFKQIGAVALIIVGSVVLMGQAPPPRTVEANEFTLRDGSGRVRGQLSMTNSGPALSLYDQNGHVRTMLDVLASGPGLSLLDANGKIRAALVVEANGPGLALVDGNGKKRAMVNLVAEGPGIYLFDDAEKGRVALYLLAGEPKLSLRDRNERVRTSLAGATLGLEDEEGFQTTIGSTELITPRTGETHKTSAASLVLLDKDKKVLWKAP